MFFKDVIGQEEAKTRLIREVKDGRIAHALLFNGPLGAGKMPLALAYARYLCCTNRGEKDACGTCPSCIKFNKLVHPDVHFIFPTVKKMFCDELLPHWRHLLLSTPYFTIDHWLNEMDAENAQAIIYQQESSAIIKKLNFKSSEGGYKVVILWLPERMHVVFANKILKLLEEPPEFTVFLLVTENQDKLLPTIISRCQPFYIPRIEEGKVTEALQSNYGVESLQAKSIAHISNGNFVKALETIHLNKENEAYFDLFVGLMRLAYMRKVKDLKLWSENIAALGRERQKNFLQYSQHMVRENFMNNFRQPNMIYMTPDETKFSSRFCPFINERNVIEIMEELSAAQADIEQNVNAKMVFFDFALKMIMLIMK